MDALFFAGGAAFGGEVPSWSVLSPKLAQTFVLELGLFRDPGSCLFGSGRAFPAHGRAQDLMNSACSAEDFGVLKGSCSSSYSSSSSSNTFRRGPLRVGAAMVSSCSSSS